MSKNDEIIVGRQNPNGFHNFGCLLFAFDQLYINHFLCLPYSLSNTKPNNLPLSGLNNTVNLVIFSNLQTKQAFQASCSQEQAKTQSRFP